MVLMKYNIVNEHFVSLFQSHYNQQGFILTQLPLNSTVIDLWQMLYDYQSNTVVITDVIHYDDKVNSPKIMLVMFQFIGLFCMF